MDLGLLVLRGVVGLTLAAHGAQKLFGWFGGYGLSQTGRYFEQLGFVPGRRNALFAGLGEAVGGLLLAFGLFTPAAAALVIAVMTVAAFAVHVQHGFFAHQQGYEYTFILAAAALSLAFTGAGAYSLDGLIGLHDQGPVWGIAALAVGVIGGALRLGSRRIPATQKTS
ncbi:MAG TPA: DoxX family protein [Gemmatimonadales bacterium]|nr:DoxX family protein [Gemmatimonadales bacterium]